MVGWSMERESLWRKREEWRTIKKTKRNQTSFHRRSDRCSSPQDSAVAVLRHRGGKNKVPFLLSSYTIFTFLFSTLSQLRNGRQRHREEKKKKWIEFSSVWGRSVERCSCCIHTLSHKGQISDGVSFSLDHHHHHTLSNSSRWWYRITPLLSSPS